MNQRSAGRCVGVVGLGIMGSSIAANLQKSGFQVLGVEIHASTRRRMAPLLTRVMVVAEASTFSLKDKQAARTLLAQAGIEMIDAPLSGTGAQAKTKDLTVYASGDAKSIQWMMPVFKGFSRAQFSVGEFGNGMKMKLVANLLVAIHNVSAAEALLFGVKMGLDPKRMVQVVGGGAGTSRMFQVRGPMMASRGWAAGHHEKRGLAKGHDPDPRRLARTFLACAPVCGLYSDLPCSHVARASAA